MTGGRWKTVRSTHSWQQGGVVHWAPVTPEEEWMEGRVTVCWPRGQRKAHFDDCSGPVTCVPCLTRMIGPTS